MNCLNLSSSATFPKLKVGTQNGLRIHFIGSPVGNIKCKTILICTYIFLIEVEREDTFLLSCVHNICTYNSYVHIE